MSLINMSQKKFILTISGHDPTSAAGMTIDIMVASKFNFHCLSVINNLTIQDAKKLYKVVNVNEKFFNKSLRSLEKNFEVSGIKIGAISSHKIIEETVNFVKSKLKIPIIIDPIIRAGGGGLFLKKENPSFIKTVENTLVKFQESKKERTSLLQKLQIKANKTI